MLDSSDLITIFDRCFFLEFHTVLRGGAEEPLYQPASTADGGFASGITGGEPPHIIYFRADYFASALHEVAHWCVAGPERRQKTDYGYWYAPDGRSLAQQSAFEQAEVKPQALEWIFSQAAGAPFKVSADNLSLGLSAGESFKQAITEQARQYCDSGLPRRARLFTLALAKHYRDGGLPTALEFVYGAIV